MLDDYDAMRTQTLYSRILEHGGDRVVPMPEPHLDLLLDRAEYYPGRSLTLPGRPCHCHVNCSIEYMASPDIYRLATVYALSKDELWRQHSWLVKRGNKIIETTSKRHAYFGVVLNELEALMFVCGNVVSRLPGFDAHIAKAQM